MARKCSTGCSAPSSCPCVTFQVHARLQTLAVAARGAVLPADLVDDAVVPAGTQVIVLPWAQTDTDTRQLPRAQTPLSHPFMALRTTENQHLLHRVPCKSITIHLTSHTQTHLSCLDLKANTFR